MSGNSDDQWISDDDRRQVREAARFSAGWIVAIIAFALVVGVAVWGLGFGFQVGTAKVVGKGHAYIQQQSAVNRIEAQAAFPATLNSIAQYTAQLQSDQGALNALLAQYPDAALASTTSTLGAQYTADNNAVTGDISTCLMDVKRYNTLAESYLTAAFIGAGMPANIVSTDPAFAADSNTKYAGQWNAYSCRYFGPSSSPSSGA